MSVAWCARHQWGNSRAEVRRVLRSFACFLADRLHLDIKPTPRVGRSRDGTVYCGFRVRPDAVLLSRRRKRRYILRRRAWEAAYARGDIDATVLQQNMASVLGMTVHADACVWRREQLRRAPVEAPVSWA